MRAKIATIPDGIYEGEAFVDSDGVVDEPLRIAHAHHEDGGTTTRGLCSTSAVRRRPAAGR